MHGAINGHLEVVEYLGDEKYVDVNARDKDGKTPLMHGAINGHLDVVKYLVDNGAKVDAMDKDGKTPLMHADEKEGYNYIVEYLNKVTERTGGKKKKTKKKKTKRKKTKRRH